MSRVEIISVAQDDAGRFTSQATVTFTRPNAALTPEHLGLSRVTAATAHQDGTEYFLDCSNPGRVRFQGRVPWGVELAITAHGYRFERFSSDVLTTEQLLPQTAGR